MERIASHWRHTHHSSGWHEHEVGLVSMILELHAVLRSDILEIGVGQGRVIDLIRDACGSFGLVDAVDLFAAENIEEKLRTFVLGDVTQAIALGRFSKRYDLVYSLGVIEHSPDIYSVFKAHFDLAKPGGLVLITVPAFSIESIFRYAAFVRKGLYKKGTFSEIKGSNLTERVFHRYARRLGLSSGSYTVFRAGPCIRRMKHLSFFNKFEKTLGSSIIFLGVKS